jgi:hypothetical protein
VKKKRERKKQDKIVGGVLRDTNWEETDKFPALKVLKQCPFVP